MKRDDTISALRNRIDKEFSLLELEYQVSISTMHIPSQLKVDILDFLNHNRVILDYLAQEISEYCSKKPSKVYFPIAHKRMLPKNFLKKLKKWFPGLKTNRPDLFDYLYQIQHYNNNEWLPEFNDLINEYKHVDFIPQSTCGYAIITIQVEGKGVRIGERGLKSLTLGEGNSLKFLRSNGEKLFLRGPQVIDHNTSELHDADPGIEFHRDEWIDFKFSNSDHSAIGFLEIIKQNVSRIEEAVRKMIDGDIS